MILLITNKILAPKYLPSILLLCFGMIVTQSIQAKLFYDQLNQDISFSSLDSSHRLSGPVINDIEQDIQGFIWVATQYGLNKYDGQMVISYLPDPKDENTLPGGWIEDILSDSEGRLWIAGESGVSLYIPESDGFYSFTDPEEHKLIQNLKFRVIAQVDENRIWFGTENGGIAVFDLNKSQFIDIISDENGLSSNKIRDIVIDGKGNAWVATDDAGINFMAAGSNTFIEFNRGSKVLLPTDSIRSIMLDRQDRVWIGSANSGVFLFDRDFGVQQHFLTDNSDPFSICSNSIYDIFQDNYGDIFIATDGGLCEWEESSSSFIRHVSNETRENSLDDDRVISLFQDRGGVLWIGTYSGINKWNRYVSSFQMVNSNTVAGKNLSSDIIYAFAEADNGDLYVGTDGGINVIDINLSTISHIKASPGVTGALQDGRITTLLIDSQQSLWVGTRNGLYVRRSGSTNFFQYPHDPEDESTLSSNKISKIIEIDNGNLAIGTYGGGVNILTSSGNIQRFKHDKENAQSLSDDRITHLAMDKGNIIWVATRGGGINRFDLSTKEITQIPLESKDIWSILTTESSLWFSTSDKGVGRIKRSDLEDKLYNFDYIGEKEGLASNFAYGLLADRQGYIWVSTNKGLSFIDLKGEKVFNFKAHHGLQNSDFHSSAFFQNQDGRMFFGGSSGFNTFTSNQVPINLYKPQIVLTEVNLMNKFVPVHRAFDSGGNIELNYDNSYFAFSVSALDYTKPEDNLYQYRFNDSGWIDLKNSNQFKFFNLASGYYQFQVRGSNNDGVWSDDILTIPVIKRQPFYYSNIAKLIYFWIAVFVAYRLFTAAQRRKLKQIAYSLQLEKEVSLRTSEIEQANNQLAEAVKDAREAKDLAIKAAQAKSNFLAMVSHEIRTPMNSIIGMSELLLSSELNANQKRYANAVSRAGDSLLNLINDILDLSKIESDKIELENHEFDFHALIEELLFLFSVRSSEKELELGYVIAKNCPKYIVGDAHRLRQVISNLLNNAIKFTSAGSIQLEVEVVANCILISVIDTGIGIEKSHFEKIFNEFQQADSTTTRNFGGTGLGLTITRKIIEQMQAKISVKSTLGEGTTFTVRLPINLPKKSSLNLVKVEDLNQRPVLLICSNDTVLKMMQSALQRLYVNFEITSIEQLRLDAMSAENALIFIDHPDFLLSRAFVSITLEHTNYCVLLRTTERADSLNELGLRRIEKPIRLDAVKAEILYTINGGNEEPASSALVNELTENNSRFSAKLLLVEDVIANQDVAVTMLEMFGCEVDIAGNGKVAIELAQKCQYDLIFMDLHMPVMDGLTATCIIRENEKSSAQLSPVPIVALTAGVFDEEKGLCLEIGMNDFMLKPFNASQLFKMIAKHIPDKQIKISTPDIHDNSASTLSIEVDKWIDADAVESIREIEVRTGKKLYLRVVDSFKTVMAKQMPALIDACKSSDRTSAMELAHAMKSLSGNVGTMVLTELLLNIETAAKSNQQIDNIDKLAELNDVFENSLESLQMLVEKMYD